MNLSSQFFNAGPALTLGEIAALTGADRATAPTSTTASRTSRPSIWPGPDDLTFLENPKFADELATTRAGAVLTTARFEPRCQVASPRRGSTRTD
jgi:UDP-3-O-[3-hydroxymyristoyl] glucosamine N-acyltransferase